MEDILKFGKGVNCHKEERCKDIHSRETSVLTSVCPFLLAWPESPSVMFCPLPPVLPSVTPSVLLPVFMSHFSPLFFSRHFCSRKRNIRSVGQFLEMKEAERRNLLRNLTDMQYQDVVTVAGNYPAIDMEVNGT